MDKNKKKYLEFFNSKIYIPPNSIENGYSLIAPLLYMFPQVVVHSPASTQIISSVKNSPNTTLLMRDFEYLLTNRDNYIGKPLIIPTAFESFRDYNYRQSLPEDFQIKDKFDELFVSESSPMYDKIKIIPDKRVDNAEKAFWLVSSSPETTKEIFNALKSPRRYSTIRSYDKIYQMIEDYRRQKTEVGPYKRLLDHRNIDERVVMFGVSALFNNKIARNAGSGEIEILSKEDVIVTENISGMKPAFFDSYKIENKIEEEVIHKIIENISTKIEKRITIDDLISFREKYRDRFLPDIYDILYEVDKEKYHHDKIRKADELSKECLEDYRFPRQLISLLSRVLSKFSVGFVREEEITRGFNKVLDIPHVTRDWRCSGLQDPTFPNLKEKTKREIINVIERLKGK